jgi:hypothetical protein
MRSKFFPSAALLTAALLCRAVGDIVVQFASNAASVCWFPIVLGLVPIVPDRRGEKFTSRVTKTESIESAAGVAGYLPSIEPSALR